MMHRNNINALLASLAKRDELLEKTLSSIQPENPSYQLLTDSMTNVQAYIVIINKNPKAITPEEVERFLESIDQIPEVAKLLKQEQVKEKAADKASKNIFAKNQQKQLKELTKEYSEQKAAQEAFKKDQEKQLQEYNKYKAAREKAAEEQAAKTAADAERTAAANAVPPMRAYFDHKPHVAPATKSIIQQKVFDSISNNGL